MTTVTCRSCFLVHQVDASNGATFFTCYLCGERMNLAAGTKSDTSMGCGNTVVDRKPRSAASPAPAAPEKRQAKIRCPECGSHLNVRAVVGKTIQCPLCTGWIRFLPETVTV